MCLNMNHFDAADFSECHSEEVISFFDAQFTCTLQVRLIQMTIQNINGMYKLEMNTSEKTYIFIVCMILTWY